MANQKNSLVEISVIIPCYNDGIYIHETLQSLHTQTFKNFEIIIIDDASNDEKTVNILSKLKQDNLQVIFLEQNSRPAAARNKGIDIAQGKYILPLDADDKIAPTYLEKAKKILDENPDTGIVYCEAELFGEKNEKWDLPPYSFPEILVANMIFATAMYKKDDWKIIGGYNEEMINGNEDYDFWLSFLELDRKVYQIPEILFYYRIKKVSRSTQLALDNENEINSYVQVFNNHQNLYTKHIKVFFNELKRKEQIIIEKDHLLLDQYQQIKDKDYQLQITGEDLTYARSIVELRDQQIGFLNYYIESLRLKNRLKYLIKKFIPKTFLHALGYTRNNPPHMKEFPDGLDTQKTCIPYTYQAPEFTTTVHDEIANFKSQPLISIIMPVYNVDPKWLDLAIKSIETQWYNNWELCIADDKSTNEDIIAYLKEIHHPQIKVKFLEENLNISGASNAALELASGEYIALMDNDDEITPDALYEMIKVINKKDAEFIYSDEDFISTDGECVNPHFKPDFSPDLLLSHNYITHFTCFKKSLLDQTAPFNTKFDGSQDYDLFLRLTEKTAKIHHIQKVLYHWRMLETSTSANSEAKPEAIERGKTVLEETLKRREIDASVLHGNLHHYFRVKYTTHGNPLVSIIIPFKDKPELLEVCVNSVLEKSTYTNYEIIGISNNSEQKETFDTISELENKDSRVSFYEYNTEFNYADINNHAVNTYAKGEHVLLLNNDIEVISPDWIEAMLEHSQRDSVGCVGAKLYYPNDTIQHAGIIIGLGGYAGHSHKMYPRDNPGYFNRLNVVQNLSALTAACLMVKKSIYNEVNGMDDVDFKVAYNDVDFCLRVLEKGYLNIYTPFAQMYHHESISRGYEETEEKIARFRKEKYALMLRHKDILTNGDPYYNPNLTLDREDFSICLK